MLSTTSHDLIIPKMSINCIPITGVENPQDNIHKSGDKTCISNYRPISLYYICITSKVLEFIIILYNKIIAFVCPNISKHKLDSLVTDHVLPNFYPLMLISSIKLKKGILLMQYFLILGKLSILLILIRSCCINSGKLEYRIYPEISVIIKFGDLCKIRL